VRSGGGGGGGGEDEIAKTDSHLLPAGWEQKVDKLGRTYFVVVCRPQHQDD